MELTHLDRYGLTVEERMELVQMSMHCTRTGLAEDPTLGAFRRCHPWQTLLSLSSTNPSESDRKRLGIAESLARMGFVTSHGTSKDVLGGGMYIWRIYSLTKKGWDAVRRIKGDRRRRPSIKDWDSIGPRHPDDPMAGSGILDAVN